MPKKTRFFTITEVVSTFNLTILTPKKFKDKKFFQFSLNRPEMELNNFIYQESKDRVALFGKKEATFFATLSKNLISRKINNLQKAGISFVVITKNFKVSKTLLEIFKKKKIIFAKSDMSASQFFIIFVPWAYHKVCKQEFLHGTLMNVYGYGVLITGDSGIGKSEVALSLLKNNHFFVADDTVIVHEYLYELIGYPSEITKDLVEIRGIGILNVKKMFGSFKTFNNSKINCIINLVRQELVSDLTRIKLKIAYKKILGVSLPLITIPIFPGRNLTQLIETAVITLQTDDHLEINQILDKRFKKSIEND
ncbi:HPr(Ser) kinase/phosphatase [symbiont of Argiope bruennichi]|uniref:HPr(Ser) kinase/phosphatase n=1 Tax=symbiont of Argiope bruennichi TaxID=2810479 RepID=UPI003DA350ED